MNLMSGTTAFDLSKLSYLTDGSLKDAMRHLTGGVSVITAGRAESRTGLTVITAHSLSMDPALMIVSVNRDSSSYAAITGNRHFCVNILDGEQKEVAERFSGKDGIRGRDRYEGQSWSVLATGALALDGALANIDCALTDTIERHSHALFIGEAKAVRVSALRRPQLVYQHGAYGAYPDAANGESA